MLPKPANDQENPPMGAAGPYASAAGPGQAAPPAVMAPSPWPGRLAWLVLLLAAGLRALYWLLPELDGDMAMWGVQALDILAGRFSFLFAGELFGGNLEAWLAAPLFAVFGAGPRVLCLAPVGVSLGLVWLVWRIGRAELGPVGGLTAMAWAGLGPWFLMQQSWEPKGAYVEVPLLALACFGLTLRLLRQSAHPAGRPGWSAWWLGLLAGLGLWTHLLMLPAVAACALLVLIQRPRLFLGRQAALALAGFLLGSLPLWLISLPQGLFSEEIISGQGRRLELAGPLLDLWRQGLPMFLGLLPAHRLPDPTWWPGLRVIVLAGLCAGLAALILRRGREIFTRDSNQMALVRLALIFLPLFLAFWLVSGAAAARAWRHLSPLYAVAPILVGAALALAWSWRPWLGGVLAALAILFNLWGSLELAPALRARNWEVYQARRQMERDLIAWLEREGRRHVYAQGFWDALPLTLAAQGQITFADQAQNHFPRHLRLADAADRPAYVLSTRAVDFGRSLELAGITARSTTLGRYVVFDDFRRAGPAVSEINPWEWTSPQPGAAEAWDRDITTRWTTHEPQRPGQRLMIDLGRVQPDLCRLEIMPGRYEDFPGGIEVRVSADGMSWATAARHAAPFAPVFWSLDRPLVRVRPARLEIAFAPRPARYLELVQTSGRLKSWWSVAELFLFRAAGQAQAEPAPGELARDPGLAQSAPVYGPPPLLARLPENRAGLSDPRLPPEFAPPAGGLDLTLAPNPALCLPAEAAPASLAILEGFLAGPPSIARRGGQVIVSGLRPNPAEPWSPPPAGSRVKASHRTEDAGQAIDGRADTRWHPGLPQAPGQWLELDLGEAPYLAGIRLEVGDWPLDWPRGLRVETDPGDGLWREPAGLRLVGGAPVWGGGRVLRRGGVLAARFTPQKVRGIRLTQTGSHPVQHWSLARLTLLPARPD
ncbi:MAG: hypothetical protein ACOZHQ_07500 [Thermodesulfobacteriota bacterium]